jgi:hypothetical protein
MNHPELLKNTCFTLDNKFSECIFLSQFNLKQIGYEKKSTFFTF